MILRFAAFNLAAFALLGAALMQGWIAMVIDADGTGLSVAIFGVFLAGFAASAVKVRRISHELECVRNYQPCIKAAPSSANAARLKAAKRSIKRWRSPVGAVSAGTGR